LGAAICKYASVLKALAVVNQIAFIAKFSMMMGWLMFAKCGRKKSSVSLETLLLIMRLNLAS
jgi:hypothetical protein